MTQPTVILFHAFPLSKKMWGPQVKGLAGHARLVLPDLPGFGRNARAVVRRMTSITAMARAAAKELDRLKIRGPVMAGGISMGGYVALEFARLYPKRVLALGLFSTRSGPDDPEQKKKRRQLARKVVREGMQLLVKTTAPKLLGKTTLKKNPALLRMINRMVRSGSPRGTANALVAMAGRRDNTRLLHRLTCPVLIIAGREDVVFAPDESRAMGRLARHSQVHVLSGAGHLVNLEKPQAFNRLFTRFLRKL